MVVDRGVVARRDGEGWKEERKPFYLVKHKVMVVMVMVMIVLVMMVVVIMVLMVMMMVVIVVVMASNFL